MRMFLGVDGGGTLTRALLVDEKGRALGAGQAGPSNIHQVDRKTIRRNLHKAISSALLEVDSSKYVLEAACFGLAGSSAPESKDKLNTIIGQLSQFEGVKIGLTTDAEIALRGGLVDDQGLLLIAGTGSICMGRNAAGDLVRTGGWGLLADDGGSALWIGRRAIESAVRQADGRLKEDVLGTQVFEALGIDSMDSIVSVLHSPSLSKAKIAQLAHIVTRLGESGNHVALDIVDSAIREIVGLIRATLPKIGLKKSDVIAVGGLTTPDTWFRQRLDAAIALELKGTVLRTPKLSPVCGALIEALGLAGHELTPQFTKNVASASAFFLK